MSTTAKDQPQQESLPQWVLRAAANRKLHAHLSEEKYGAYITQTSRELLGRVRNITDKNPIHQIRREMAREVANLVLDFAISYNPEREVIAEFEDIRRYINDPETKKD